jgi:2-iminobutanoate/2-iminopropanoate deaminase
MPRQIITTANAPSSPLYTQGVKAGPHVLVSGIAGIDPGTGSLAGTRSRIRHGRHWRIARPSSRRRRRPGGRHRGGVLLTNPVDFAGLNEEYAQWFPSEQPTR